MALVTPNNLYSGYAQVVNDAQHVAFRSRILQHHFAQQQALDDYYRKMPMTINEKGTRDNDRPTIAKSLLGIKDYYIKHKNELRNGDQAAAFNYEKMIRNHQDLVQTSQTEGLTDTHVGKLRYDPKTSYMFQSPDIVDKLAKSHLPVDDPNFEPFDLDTALIPPKPLVKDEYMKRYDKIQFGDNWSDPIHNSDGTVTRINTPTPSHETLETIKSNALVDYLHDPSVTKAVDELGTDASNPYNPIFKKYFGKDIENGSDATAALILATKLPQPIKETNKPDAMAMLDKRERFAVQQQARNDFFITRRQQNNERLRETFDKFKSTSDVTEQSNHINKYLNQAYDAGTSRIEGAEGAADVNSLRIDGKFYKGKFIDLPSTVKEEFRMTKVIDGKNEVVYPDGIYLTEDKTKIVPIQLGKRGKSGNYEIIKGKAYDPQVAKTALGKLFSTAKERGAEVTGQFGEVLPSSTPTKTAERTKASKSASKTTHKGLPVF